MTASSVARLAALLAERSRAAILLALLDGRAWTAGELARHAGIGPSAASEHLTLLVARGLLVEERQGRHRYLRLATAEVAELVEDLVTAAGQLQRPGSPRAGRAAQDLAAARTCYDHLAGVLGVALFDGLVGRGIIEVTNGLVLTSTGRAWFAELTGRSPLAPAGSRRPLLRTCLDWTERRPHLGGALGASLREQLVQREWIIPSRHRHRAVRVTPAGAEALQDLLGIRLPRHPGGS